jgi:hypothetical protein
VLSDQRRAPRYGSPVEKRKQKRTPLALKGKLFSPDSGFEDDCRVVDFSPDGAGVKSAISAAVGTRLVLYVEGFGRFEGTVVARDRTRLGVQFQPSAVKRERTIDLLSAYVASGTTQAVPLRSALRAKGVPPLHDFTCADGQLAACEVIDIALGGALLKTEARPEIGEFLTFGTAAARVVRHTATGIAVQFVGRQAAESAPAL